VNTLAIAGVLLIGAPGVGAAWFLDRHTRTGCLPPIDENPHQEEVTFP
jgi:hypothetical protein